jgi:hypothetical protein
LHGIILKRRGDGYLIWGDESSDYKAAGGKMHGKRHTASGNRPVHAIVL